MAALSAAVALSAVLPLTAASAGPVDAPREQSRPPGAAGVESIHGSPGAPLRGPLDGSGERRTAPEPDESSPSAGDREPGPAAAAGPAPAPAAGPETNSGPTARCGPEIELREWVMAQTCVLEEEDHTRGRTYYRNTSGAPLMGVLTLLRPDGRTLQVNCELPASGNPGSCETPRERTLHPLEHEEPYTAIAEIATADAERMLVRAGSNPAGEQPR